MGCSKEGKDFVCRITSVEGPVEVTKKESQETRAAKKGLKLTLGDQLKTGKKAMVRLRFKDFATVLLGEESLYVVTAQKKTEDKGIIETSTELLKGIGLVKVKKDRAGSFKVKTPYAITGVLGTSFGLEVFGEDGEHEDGEHEDEHSFGTNLAVLDGKVSFAGGGGSLVVKGGKGAFCNGIAPPGIVKKFSDLSSKLNAHLENFLKAEAKGEKRLNSVFRYY